MATDIIAQGMAGSAMKAVQQAINRIEGLPAGVIYKGSVDYYNNLPANPTLGEAYTVKYTGTSGTILFGAEY